MPRTERFATRLLRWYDRHGRHDLPWQSPRTPYRVWLSEVMLQQTQVATVIPYFVHFVERFPTLHTLAAAPLDAVLSVWSGLGYYSRARNLQRAARLCMERHDGELPCAFDDLCALPGIGRSTAGAILAQAHGLRFPILDGNVKRLLTRHLGLRGWPGSSAVLKPLWTHAEARTPARRVADYTQAMMDLGATVCTRTRPRCDACPLAGDCVARHDGLTAELPERRPTRALPTRRTVMLLLRDARGRVLLQRRPPSGVWAQLWSLPEASDAAAARRWFAREQGLNTRDIAFRQLPGFVHAFSHYRIDVTLLAADTARSARVADDADRRWLKPEAAAALGLPAPVRKLIRKLMEGEPCRAA